MITMAKTGILLCLLAAATGACAADKDYSCESKLNIFACESIADYRELIMFEDQLKSGLVDAKED
jgi:hypothetical protein